MRAILLIITLVAGFTWASPAPCTAPDTLTMGKPPGILVLGTSHCLTRVYVKLDSPITTSGRIDTFHITIKIEAAGELRVYSVLSRFWKLPGRTHTFAEPYQIYKFGKADSGLSIPAMVIFKEPGSMGSDFPVKWAYSEPPTHTTATAPRAARAPRSAILAPAPGRNLLGRHVAR